MKTQQKILLIISSLLVFLIISCRSEESQLIDSTNDPGLKANSIVADLMLKTSLHDGSKDNIIDHASCFSIVLPINVIVNGESILVESAADYEVIESIFDEYVNDEDSLEIIYPVTLEFSDFTRVIVNNETELESYIDDDCNNEIDDDIECVDFIYPITASIFNTNNELLETITINTDNEMHDFIENLSDDVIVNIKFPISILLSDGSDLIINNLDELESNIENFENDCDEDDDNDFDDDDNTNITEQEFSTLLMSCSWTVDEIDVNDQNLENLRDYIITFNTNGMLTAALNANSSNGTWSISSDNNGLRLNLSIESLDAFNMNWRLHQIEKEDNGKDKLDLRVGQDQLKLIKNCN